MEGDVGTDPVEAVVADPSSDNQDAVLRKFPVDLTDGIGRHTHTLGDIRSRGSQRIQTLRGNADPPQNEELLTRSEPLGLGDGLDARLVDLRVPPREGIRRVGDRFTCVGVNQSA